MQKTISKSTKTTKFIQFDGLTKENITEAVAAVDTFMSENGVDHLQRERFVLLLEDVLLDYAKLDSGARLRVITHRSYRKIIIRFRIRCESRNLLDDKQGYLQETILNSMETRPEWKYSRGENVLTYREKPLVPGLEALKYLFRYMGNEKKSFRTGILLRLLNILLLVTEPLLSALIITAFNGSDLKRIILIAILIAVVEAGSSLFTYIASLKLTKAYMLTRENMQTDLAKNMLKIKTEHIDVHSSGLFVQRLMNETDNVINGLDEVLLLATELLRLISLLVAFALVSPIMLLFAIILFAIYFFIVRAQSRVVTNGTRRLRVYTEKLNGFIVEMVKAHRDIKVHHCEDSFLQKAEENIYECTERTRELRNQSGKYIFGRGQFVAWTNLAYLILLVIMMAHYGMPPATALVLYNYNGKAYASARALSGATTSVYALLLAAERVYQILKSPDFAQEEFGQEKLETVQGDIDVRDVYYSYKVDGKPMPVLKGLSLHISPGETVALVGRSGCGKSTLLSLITRLHDPTRGSILLDGIEIKDLDQDSLRGNIGMVTQMPYLFNMSIRDNFAIVKKDVTDEEIVAACKTACIHDDIMNFSEGYDTVIGEGGILISGGQRQRIAIARCLIGDYPILFLDEATSALDNETQAKIQKAIEGMHGKTIIMIAHRLSTVVNCNRLFFIEDGKVLASGTHRELLETCPEYRGLYGEDAAGG